MATYGYTFQSGDGVTPTRLNDARTISAIVNADISDDTITNAKIKSDAAIAHSKLANITAGQVLLGNASNVPTATAMTGDVTVTSGGVTAIGSAKVVTSMVNDAAVTAPKLSGGQTGSAPIFGVRAWGKFAGQSSNIACTVSASGNVTSVTRISSGVYEVVMSTALPDADYSVLAMSSGTISRLETGFTETTTTFRLNFVQADGSAQNPTECMFMVIR